MGFCIHNSILTFIQIRLMVSAFAYVRSFEHQDHYQPQVKKVYWRKFTILRPDHHHEQMQQKYH